MRAVPIADKRNLALLGHTHSGKTTLIDALAFKLGANDRQGSVDNGSSIADYSDEEKARNLTIAAKPFSFEYNPPGGSPIGLCVTDTPGYADFAGQVIAAVRAADAALIVVDAVAGVQVGTHRGWAACAREGLMARGIVITGLDRDNADFGRVVEALRAVFGVGCVPVSVPADGGGVASVLEADEDGPLGEWRLALLEKAAETDDVLIEKFLGGGGLTPEELSQGLKKAVAAGDCVPIFACTGTKGLGLDALLAGIDQMFPAPEGRARRDAAGQPIAVAETAPFVGQVWRTVNDPFVGQLALVRVLGGTLTTEGEWLNAGRKTKERVGGLLRLNGRKQEAMTCATAGDVVAIPKLKDTHVGDTLCAPANPVVCAPLVFPKPVAMQACKGKTQADDDKIGTALQRVCEDDPTLQMERNAETHEMILKGLGDVHLDVAVSLMKNRSHVEVLLSTPKVPYHETVTALGQGHYKHKKQSGGRGQYGEVYLKVEPLTNGETEWFEDAVVGGVIPHNFIPAVQKGAVEGMNAGALAGYPVTNVKVTVYDGSYHDVDSSEIAFKIAASRALREGMLAAHPVLLEPIMSIKISLPDQYLGDINGDLNHRRGRILGLEAVDGMQVITAEVPLAELFRYSAELRSITAGQGSFEMEFARYDQVPGNITQKVVAEAAKNRQHHAED